MKQSINNAVAVQALRSELENIRMRQPRYSLRAFARRLGIAAPALSEMMRGRRPVTVKMARLLSERLALSPEQLQTWFQPSPEGIPVAKTQLQLNADQFALMSEWYHFALLSLVETTGFQNDSKWIAGRLHITVTQAQTALERLLRLGLLSQSENGEFKPTHNHVRTSDDVMNLALRKSHHTNLQLAEESLERDPIPVRDFTAVTMAIDPDKLPEAKKRIRRFQKELCEFLESDNKKAVYKLCLQMFPLSHGETP